VHSKSWCEEEELMMSNNDENAARLADQKIMHLSAAPSTIASTETNAAYPGEQVTIRANAIPPTAAFNGSAAQAVPEVQVDSLNPISVTNKRGKFSKYPRSVIITAIIGIIAVLAGGIFLLLSLLQSTPSVVAYRTHMQRVNLSIGGSGLVYASQQLNISFPMSEQVTNVYVKPGDQVKTNQPLIQLDLSQLRDQIKQAADDVAAAQNYLNSATSTPQASAAQLAYDQAVSHYNALQAQVSSPSLHNGTLVAPFSGTVTDVTVQRGELARANARLVTLQSESTLVAHVEVPLQNLPHVFTNQDVLITPSAIPNLTVHGTVSSIIQQSSAATDTFEVRVTIDNTSKQFLPGMSVFARLQEPLQALVVPRMAVINPDQGAIVFVINHGQITLRHVQTGGYAGDLMVIEAGLSNGDEVVLTGVDTLHDGETINVSKVQS
jgi:membrane fusion protein (multidrug efflux system)